MSKLHWIVLFCFVTVLQPLYASHIGIIGGGAAGLVSAWLLEKDNDVTLFEARDRLGGHADTVDVKIDGKIAHVEAGAEFFNERTFPHFLKLLDYYHVPLMKFSLVGTYYSKDGKDKIILPPYHDGFLELTTMSLKNIKRSLKLNSIVNRAQAIIDKHLNKTTFQDFVEEEEQNDTFLNQFLYPYIGASYGVSPELIRTFTAYNAMYYVVNGNRMKDYKWYEVPQGLKYYIDKVAEDLQKTSLHLNTKIAKITHEGGLYQVWDDKGNICEFDTLIITTNAQIAGKLIESIPGREALSKTLKGMQYYDTEIAIHGDASLMPPNKRDWRVINTVFNGSNSAMTVYKSWHSDTPVFKSWLISGVNKKFGDDVPLPKPLYALIHYRHPVLDVHFAKSRDIVNAQQGIENIWFGGMWSTDVDSHESAILSAIKIARRIAPQSARLAVID